MNRDHHGFWNRNSIRALFLVVAFSAVQISTQAATLPGWKAAPYSQSGTKTTFGLGNSSSQITPPPGYQYAGNYGIPNPAYPGTTFGLTAEGKVFIPNRAGYQDGVMYPYRYEGKLDLGALAGALAGFVGGPLGVACALACPLLAQTLTGADLRYKPDDPKVIERKLEGTGSNTGAEYRWTAVDSWGTPEASCRAYLSRISGLDPVSEKVFVEVRMAPSNSDMACVYNEVSKETGKITYRGGERTGPESRQATSQGDAKYVPATIDQIRAAMEASFPKNGIAPGTIVEALDKGADIPLPKPSDITVTGPSTIPGGSTTTTNSDGSRTVETTSRNFSSGSPGSSNVINNTSNTTTTTIYNIDNSVRSTSTSTSTPSGAEATKEEEKEKCEEGSMKVACAEFDEPEGKIPKETKNVTFQMQDLPIPTGQCPADVSMSFRSASGIGAQKIVDWRSFCDMAIPLRAIVMALAAIMGFFIVMPGGRVE